MRFSDRVWKHQVLPLIDESFAKHIEIAAQLCKVGDEVSWGRNSTAPGVGVGYWELWEDLKDLGFVRNPQLQYTEIYFKDYGKTWERVETKHEVHPIRIIEEEEHGKAG